VAFKKALLNFINMLQNSSLLYNKWSSDSIKDDNQHYRGGIEKILELPKLEQRVYLISIVKIQKIYLLLNQIDDVIKTQLLTQYTLQPIVDEILICVGQTMLYEMYLKIMLLLAEILKTLSEYEGAIRLYQMIRIISDLFGDTKSQQQAYYELGECYRATGDYPQAQHCFELFLHNSWFLKDAKNELKAYDCIGMTYFYQNDLEKAQRYHLRSLIPDSALEKLSFKEMVEHRLISESNRKDRLLATKDKYFKFEIAKGLLQVKSDIEGYLKVRNIHQLLTSVFAVDNLAVLGPIDSHTPEKPSNTNNRAMRLINSKKIKYTADFTPEGYSKSMQLSNPAKFFMIQEGTLTLDENTTKQVNLYDASYTRIEDKKLLSHLSPNNSKTIFAKSADGSEICLQFLQKQCKDKMKDKVDSLKDDLLEIIEFLIDKLASKENSQVKVKFKF
jgi:tetratricopeptide (TPR) repeat protein